jgi:predicted AAA+ superfamily ATPase
MVQLVKRHRELAWLRRWRGHDLIKVVTGVRRCGKSTLLRQFAEELVETGADPRAVVAVNLEDPAFRDLLDRPMALYDHVLARLTPGQVNTVFIDELQLAPEFERVADGLFIHPQVDLYVTGSNARLLSGDLATLLAGRYIELPLLPLGFADYVQARPAGEAPGTAFAGYLRYGGMPLTTRLEEGDAIDSYLDGVVATVLMKDVIPRRGVRDTSAFESLVAYLADGIATETTAKRLADTLTSAGRPVSSKTIESYMAGLTAAYLWYRVDRFDLRGKRVLARPQKWYCVDPGIRAAVLGGQFRDEGRVLENVVFLELLRRSRKVRVGRQDGREIDFVATGAGERAYIQVAATVRDPATLERELAPLRAAPGHHPRLLLTMDATAAANHDGIIQRNVVEWLLES